MDTNEANRIETTNSERYQLSLAQGWHFRADAPDLLGRWRVLPFSQHGDKRLAFGMLAGAYQGMPFTTFDFHRRPTVTSVHTRWTNKKINELDTITIDSVRVVTLPVAMPNFQIVSSVDSAFETDAYPEPATADRKFNRWYKLIGTDPNLAVHILTPQVMSTMRQLKLHTWSLVGNELVYVEHPIFGRTKPDDVLAVLGKLLSLVSVLPLHLGQRQVQRPQQYGYPGQFGQPPRGY
ncbi:hypothetical protein [Amycolatopsis sp. NPDC059657]|uniref:hypothetical protein n=1 Tax=Amycolatopsis sp. NPDC059657 TaxID=3346899 RepID=UPI00366A7A60